MHKMDSSTLSPDWLQKNKSFHRSKTKCSTNQKDGGIKYEKLNWGKIFSSSNYLLAQSLLPQCEQSSPTDPGELYANVDQMYQVTD